MPIVKVELPSKEAASRVRSENPRLKNQRECEGSGTQHSHSTSLAKESGLALENVLRATVIFLTVVGFMCM